MVQDGAAEPTQTTTQGQRTGGSGHSPRLGRNARPRRPPSTGQVRPSGQAADSDELDVDDEPEEPESEPVDVLEDVLDVLGVVEEPAPLPDRLSVR